MKVLLFAHRQATCSSRNPVYYATKETGQSFELEDCQPQTKVQEVQDVLVSLTGVSNQDQLLFVGDARLESQRALGSYRLPANDRPIFLFNRQKLVPDSPPPCAEVVQQNLEVVLPKSPPMPRSSHIFETATDPAIRALPSYERQFKYHFQKGHAILSASHSKFDACKRLARGMHVQEMALETVRGNMEHHYKSIDNSYREFVADFQRQSQQHTEILANFGKDIEKLRACKLHPALRTEGRQTLLDCVKEGSLRKSAEDCAVFHKQLCGKVAMLANDYMDMKQKVESFLSNAPSVDFQNLESALEAHSRYTEEQASILQSLSKDVNRVKRLVDECAEGRYSSLYVQDAMSALGPMYDVQHKSHLPRMEDCDRELGKLLGFCIKGKNAMNMCVHTRMQTVASLQANIRNMRNQLSAFREVMVHQDENFEVLKQARKIGSSYKACFAEVIRRKAYIKLYMGQAGQLAEKMARKREREVARREEFLHLHSVYLPRDLLVGMGLFEVPSQCLVDIAPFDSNLLDIDVPDIEHYGPQYLVGSLLNTTADWCVPEASEDLSIDEIEGTSKLEVENARLKAQLASSIAIICSIDASFQPECLGDVEDQELKFDNPGSLSLAERTAEALRLKDEHGKHLHNMLNAKQMQCSAYEARIRELEDRLREQEEHKFSSLSSMSPETDMVFTKDSRIDTETMFSNEDQANAGQSETSVVTGDVEASRGTGEPMDGVSSVPDTQAFSNSDESNAQSEEKVILNEQADSIAEEPVAQNSENHILKAASVERSSESFMEGRALVTGESEDQMKSVLKEVLRLRTELETNVELLRQCQMNSAHLENRLHEAREEARINLCAADRRASEYNVLRASSVKLRALMERLRNCIASPIGGTVGFADSLRALSVSLASDAGDEASPEFRASISVLADRVGVLAQQRAELLERCSIAEATQSQMRKEVESKAEIVKNLFTKCKLEKQASKEKICLTRFEVHELALFLPKAAGHWEALNRKCPNYFLSEESIALFGENLPVGEHRYILGQIVHIERHVARENGFQGSQLLEASGLLGSSLRPRQNPYGLAIGTEFFVVTVAMVPGLHQA